MFTGRHTRNAGHRTEDARWGERNMMKQTSRVSTKYYHLFIIICKHLCVLHFGIHHLFCVIDTLYTKGGEKREREGMMQVKSYINLS